MSGRIRTIKPELLEDAVTAGLSDGAFRLFIATILMSDDWGCFRAEPQFIKGQVWWRATPTADVDSAVTELDHLIAWYTVKGQRYGHIRNWEKHQKVSHRGKRRVPPPSECAIEPPENFERVSGASPEDLRPDLRPPTNGSPTKGPPIAASPPPQAPLSVPEEEPEPEPVAKLKAEERYARAYAEGQERSAKAPFPVPSEPWERGAIANLILTYLPDLRGEELLEGIRATSAAYRRAKDDKPQFEKGFAPKKCLEWASGAGWKYRPFVARQGPKATLPKAEAPLMPIEDARAAAADLMAAIGGGGRRSA